MKHDTLSIKVFYVFFCIILFANLASSTTITINASKDTYLYSTASKQNYNYGSSTDIALSTSATIKNGLIYFNLSSIPISSNITNAYISLYGHSGSTSEYVNAYLLNNTWDEGTGDDAVSGDGATWKNNTNISLWNVLGGDVNITLLGTQIYVSGAGERTNITVTQGVQWIINGLTNNGFFLNYTGTSALFYSKDSLSASNRPVLVIVYAQAPVYPIFYNYSDNNNTLIHDGKGLFNVNINSSNGTAWLEINNINISSNNISNYFNSSYNFLTNGTYNYRWWAYGNDSATLNMSSWQYYTVANDIINPNLTIIKPTAINYTYTSILVNISALDNKNISRIWYNWNGTNITYLTPLNITFTQGTKTLYVWANDSSNNINSTNVTFYIDSLAPTLTAINPLQSHTYASTNLTVNITSLDSGIGLNTCWYRNDTDLTNITIACNTLFNISQSIGIHSLYYWSNDSLNNIANLTITYQISMTNPNVNLIAPNDNQWLNYNNIYFNFTAQDPAAGGIKNCSLFTNSSGTWSINLSNTTAQVGGSIFNYFMRINITDGSYIWNAKCYESTGTNFGIALTNYTINIDTLFPNATITSINSNTGSKNVNISVNASDINLDYCNYTLYYGVSVYAQSASNSLNNCNVVIPLTIGSFSTDYNFTFIAVDKAGNKNITSQVFSVSDFPVTPGGGGSSPISENGKWTLTTETGTAQYDLRLTAGSSRTINLVFENLGTSARTITLSCSGDLCDLIDFKNSFNLPVQKDLKTSIPLNINLLKDTPNGEYVINILATDESGNKNILTLNINVGNFGFFTNLATKLISSKSINGLNIPYLLILFAILLPGWFIFSIIFKKQSWGSSVSFFISMFISIIFIYLI